MRKKITLISVISVFIFLGVFSCETWFITFLATKCLSGRTDGKQGIIRSIIIPWRNFELHVHHWLLALIVGGVFAVKGFYVPTPEVFYGAISAIVFQGIYCYEDWFRIIKRRPALSASPRRMPLAVENDNVPSNQPQWIQQLLPDSIVS